MGEVNGFVGEHSQITDLNNCSFKLSLETKLRECREVLLEFDNREAWSALAANWMMVLTADFTSSYVVRFQSETRRLRRIETLNTICQSYLWLLRT